MKSFIVSLLVLSASPSGFSQLIYESDRVILRGLYQGKSISVLNPENSDGSGRCATGFTVNDSLPCTHYYCGGNCIDFWCYDLSIGDSIELIITHAKGCPPKILNPEVFTPKSTFEIEKIGFSNNNNLEWITTNEHDKVTFFIEQYRWNRWIKIGEIRGLGVPDSCSYIFDISSRLHSRENGFRVGQIDHTGKKRVSKKVIIDSGIEEVDRETQGLNMNISNKIKADCFTI